MKSKVALSLLFILFLFSCEKEEHYDVIYPGSYYPVYPNSWWKYINQDSVVSYDSAGPSYSLHNYKMLGGYDDNDYSVPCYVPYLNGSPIYYYDKIETQVFPFGSSRWPILNETTGFTFQKDWIDPRNGNPVEMVVVKGKYFNGNDSILILETHVTMNVSDAITTREFAKNIGMIRQFTCDTISGDTISKVWLIDYYVSFDSTSIDY